VFVYVNSRAAEMWGSTPEKMKIGVFWDWSPKMMGSAAEKLLRRAIVSGRRANCETFSPIGGLWLGVRVSPISGGLTGIYLQDISDRKSVEAALRESEERFRQVFEQNPLGMVTADLDGHLREVNPSLCQMLEYEAEELTRLTYLDIVHPEDREECARRGHAAATGATPHFQLEERFVRKSGEPVGVKINVYPIRGHDGRKCLPPPDRVCAAEPSPCSRCRGDSRQISSLP
jgi:PAS domain S-box-containing protein